MSGPTAPATTRSRLAWVALGLALGWIAWVRVPLVAHAAEHLDSDLAVDGLTLLDAVHGHWRWHFPGTPHMGIGPLLLALPQALAWGATPGTLVSGGVAAYLLATLGIFLVARRAFAPAVAAWGLVPLAFASTGTLWLAGRLTGGHLASVGLHALAFERLAAWIDRGTPWRAGLLGLACGLALWTDRMAVFTVVGVVIGGLAAAGMLWRRGRFGLSLLAFALSAAIGYAPHEIGTRVDPHDAYREQFDPLLNKDVLVGHARLLLLDCLPRLIAGHRLPGLESEPSPASVGVRLTGVGRTGDVLDAVTAAAALVLFVVAMATLAFNKRADGKAGHAVRIGLLGSSVLVVAGFVVNRNIFNSDNYRYLVLLLVPWSIGFGLLMSRLAGRHVRLAWVLAIAFATLSTIDTARWYAGFGWLGEPAGRVRRDALRERVEGDPAATHLFGDYWDVYRLSFLLGRRVEGVPYPIYPNRFPGWSRGLGTGRGKLIVARPRPGWPDLLRGAWRDDGRDPAELAGVAIEAGAPAAP